MNYGVHNLLEVIYLVTMAQWTHVRVIDRGQLGVYEGYWVKFDTSESKVKLLVRTNWHRLIDTTINKSRRLK